MADGSAELFFHYKGVFDEVQAGDNLQKSFPAGIRGPSQHFNRFCIYQNFPMCGVYLYPFALQRLLNIPASALSNEMCDLKSLLGQEGEDLEDQLIFAKEKFQELRL